MFFRCRKVTSQDFKCFYRSLHHNRLLYRFNPEKNIKIIHQPKLCNMNDLPILEVIPRYNKKKYVARNLRLINYIPALIRNENNDSLLIATPRKKLTDMYRNDVHFHNKLFRLQFQDEDLIKEITETANCGLINKRQSEEDRNKIIEQGKDLYEKIKKNDCVGFINLAQEHWVDEYPTHIIIQEYQNVRKTTVEIPIKYENVPDCIGTQGGQGYLNFTKHSLTCSWRGIYRNPKKGILPDEREYDEDNQRIIRNIPQEIELDVKDMEIGDVIRVQDIIPHLPHGLFLKGNIQHNFAIASLQK